MTPLLRLAALSLCFLTLAAPSLARAADEKLTTKPATKPVAPPPVLPVEKVTVTSADGTDVLKWKDGKRAAFYLAFDDACPTDLTNVIPELQKRKIVGTFYVITGSKNFAGNARWEAAAKSPYVVLANHTVNHKDFPTVEAFEAEVVEANKTILKVQPGSKPNRIISFGKPGGVKYGITDDQIRQVLARHDMLDRLPFWGGGIHVKTVDQANQLVDQAVKKGETGHLDFHGVGGDWLVTPLDLFHAFLDKLEASRNALWIADAASIGKYAALRKASQVRVVENTPAKVRLSVTTTLDTKLYDEPLSLATKVPAVWKKAVVTQGEAKATVPVTDGVAVYDALAGGPEVVVAEGK